MKKPLSLILFYIICSLISSSKCDRSSKKIEIIPEIGTRIIGGNEVTIMEHPYMVSIRIKYCMSCQYFHKCGGTIYKDNAIITAAHCVYERPEYDIQITAGSSERNGEDGFNAGINKVIIHDKFNEPTTDYDVALLFLDRKLPIDNVRIATIKELINTRPTVGTNTFVIGWGDTTENGERSKTLLHVEIPILSDTTCITAYGKESFTSRMLCAGSTGKDACQYDSGGPMIENKTLVGITSWAIGCARAEFPGVYTSIADVKYWIQSTEILQNLVSNSTLFKIGK